MKRSEDYAMFSGFMAELGEGSKPFQQPSSERIEIYFRCLQDMDIEIIRKNAEECLRRNPWFPSIAEIRKETDNQLDYNAQQDYDAIEHLCQNFLFPGFYEAGMNAICLKLKGRDDLIEIVKRHGSEIAESSNPTATRAQMIKLIKVYKERDFYQLESGIKDKEIEDSLGKLIKDKN